MSSTIQTVTVISNEHFGRRVPSKVLGDLLRAIPEVVRYSIRMAFEARSRGKGQRPDWLAAASDIRFLDHSGDDNTVLHFEAPRLGDTVQAFYRQSDQLTTRPNPSDTGFDLLGDVISDITRGNDDSELYDRPLLRQIQRFKTGLDHYFQRLEFAGSRYALAEPAVITADVIDVAQKLSHITPHPQRIRIVGKMDIIRNSTNSFALKLSDGQEVRGVLNDGDITGFAELLGRQSMIFGTAFFRPSGKLLRVDADEIHIATDRDQFFSQIPKPTPARYDLKEVLREQQHKQGISAIYGKWPGDESDEEIAKALREMR